MKESYISLITPECKNCLSFKKKYSKDVLPVGFKLLSNMQSSKNQLNQIHTNIDKNLINQYLGKIFNKCEKVILGGGEMFSNQVFVVFMNF